MGTNDDPIYLQFRRRGQWLGATEQEGDGYDPMPGILTSSTFTDNLKILVPFVADVSFSWIDETQVAQNEAYFIFTNAAAKLAIIEGESWGTASGEFADTAVAAASGGNVVRFTPADTNPNSLGMSFAAYGFNTTIRRFQIFAVLANNHASTTFDTYISWYNILSNLTGGRTKTKTIDASTTDPRIFYWDEFILSDELDNHIVSFNVSASAAAGTLDVDYFVIVGIDDSTSIVHLPSIQTLNVTPIDGSEFMYTVLDHRLLTHTTPIAYEEAGSITGDVDGSIPYDGNISLHASGNIIANVVIAVDNVGSWVMNDGTNDCEVGMTVTRSRGYLTPR